MPTSTADLWDTIAADAGQESALWNAALRPREEQERNPVFSRLGEPRYALGIETIYEGGDHWIVIGRVIALYRDEDAGKPLVFCAGRYTELAP